MKRIIVSLTSAAVAAVLYTGVASADAVSINFEEFPADNNGGAMPADRYASLGVRFDATDDGAAHDGISNGDPGGWDLEGTNGPTFSGFNGASYGLGMLFDTDVCGFSLDASRSGGSVDGDSLTVEGWKAGVMVESITMNFGAINVWTTFTLASVVDEVRLLGAGVGFHPFGVDNVQWESSPFIADVRKRRVNVGTQVGGDLSSLMSSDDDRLEIKSKRKRNKNRTKTSVNLRATCVGNVTRLDLRVETGATRGSIKTWIKLYDFDAGRWRKIDRFNQTRGDRSKRYANISNPDRFVRDTDGLIKVQISTVHADRAYTIRVDHVEVVTEY